MLYVLGDFFRVLVMMLLLFLVGKLLGLILALALVIFVMYLGRLVLLGMFRLGLLVLSVLGVG